ncbi:GIY-YIG nuclease family protein [Sphingomonas sp. RP10(2022)]|uniref:GIY-YIG nuclease family protein n=1 Tax=Sphingomonas liriopis TaxID=2949094 RepID=A0A9X2KV28_9SPHN|nr:GIY-YIG nuclease family protein [Sphingomonas liriopis]MCP3736573.1 GIY-YIG nuclease family protein [Sphingomonas liriopis]
MAFWAYILRCEDGSYYTGHTDNLDARIGAHQSGAYKGYTPERRPVVLVWAQDFPSRLEALEAERRIKGWSRAKKEALIRSDWQTLTRLARNRQAESSPSTGSGRTEEETEEEGANTSPTPVRAGPVEAHLAASEAPTDRSLTPTPVRAEPVEAHASTSTEPAFATPDTPIPDPNP